MWKFFVKAVLRQFRFLEAEFGFTVKSAKPPFVTYESDRLRVLIYYDTNGRHELDLRISRLGDDPRKIPAVGPSEMMLLTDERAAKKYRSPYPSTKISLEWEVQHLADLLKNFGSAILTGNDGAFEQINRLRRSREDEMAAPNKPPTV